MNYRDLEIIYEDNHLLVVNKPAGLLVHGDKTEDRALTDVVEDYIRYTYSKPGNVFVGLTHRLDRPVSGATVFAKTSKGLTRINKSFQQKEVKKTYLAITRSQPEEFTGRLEHFLLKDTEKNRVKLFDKQKKGSKKAILEYDLIASINGFTLLKVNPLTGRSHQIRAQLSKIGCIIIGDRKYGNHTKALEDYSIGLHCLKMELIHPTLKEPISFTAKLPKMPHWNFFSHLDLNSLCK